MGESVESNDKLNYTHANKKQKYLNNNKLQKDHKNKTKKLKLFNK